MMLYGQPEAPGGVLGAEPLGLHSSSLPLLFISGINHVTTRGIHSMINTPKLLEIEIAGRTWVLDRHGDLEELWDAMDAMDSDEQLPYWVEVWPACMFMAGWLEEHPAEVAGKRCLDLGCGLGLISLVAASLGAGVLAMDLEPQALRYALDNARRNGRGEFWTAVMDWREPAIRPGSLDVILAADVIYEARFAAPILDLMESSLAPGGKALVADPMRNFLPGFVRQAEERGFTCSLVTETSIPLLLDPSKSSRAALYEFRPPQS